MLTPIQQTTNLLSRVNVSAGTTSQNLTNIIFSDSNGVSFGLSGSTITASAVGGGGGAVTFSAGTSSRSLASVVFSNSNGVSFGLNGSTITGSHNALTTARASNDAVGLNTAQTNATWTVNSSGISLNAAGYAGTGFTSTTTAGTAIVGTNNTAGLSLGIPGFITTWTVPTVTNSSLSVSDAASSGTLARLAFTNLNGVTLSLSTGAGGSHTIVGSHNALTSQSNQAFSADASSTFQTLSLQNSNGISFSNNAGAVRLTHDLQFTSNTSAITSNALHSSASRVLNIVAATNSTGGGTASLSSNVSFSAANGFTFYTSAGNALVGSYTVPTVPAQFTGGFSTGGNTVGDTGLVTGRVVLAGGPNVTLSGSTNGGSMTISISGGAGAAGNTGFISAGAATASLGTVVFSNSNGVSFGANGQTVTASHNGLTTARASNDAVGLNTALTAGPLAWTVNSSGISLNAGSAAGTTSGFTGGASISGSMTHNTAGLAISLSHPAWITTAMQSNAATISNIRVSGGTTSNLLSAITFADGNGISFGLNASTMTASHNGLTSQSNQNVTAANGGFAFQTLSFSNAQGVSFQTSAGSAIVASVETSYAASNHSHGNPTLALTNLSGTTASASNGFTLSLSAGAGGGIVPVASASNGSFSFTTLAFSNANNVTFGTSAGSIVTASVAAPGAAAEQNAINLLGANTAGNTTATGSTIGLSGVNLTLSGTNNSQIVLSVPATSSLVAANGLSISTNGSTITVYRQLVSSYENIPVVPATSAMTWNGASVSYAVGFNLYEPISASYLRFPGLMTTNSTTIATLASASASAQGGLFSTINAVIYSYGTGASSRSLQSVASGSGGFSMTQQISITNSTQASYSLGVTFQAQGDSTTLTTQYSVSNTNYSFTTNQIATQFSTARYLDVPFANSLTAGPYWMIAGMSSSTSSAGAAGLAALTNCNVRYSNHYGVSQANVAPGVMGSTNLTSGGEWGAGSFSTAGGGTTAALPVSAISTLASHVRMYFRLLRSA